MHQFFSSELTKSSRISERVRQAKAAVLIYELNGIVCLVQTNCFFLAVNIDRLSVRLHHALKQLFQQSRLVYRLLELLQALVRGIFKGLSKLVQQILATTITALNGWLKHRIEQRAAHSLTGVT